MTLITRSILRSVLTKDEASCQVLLDGDCLVPTVMGVAGVGRIRLNVPGRHAVDIPGDRHVAVSGNGDPIGSVNRIVVHGLDARPCRKVGQQGPEDTPGGGVVSSLGRPDVVCAWK